MDKIQLDKAVNDINSGDVTSAINGVETIRKLLSVESNPPTEMVFNTGVIPRLIKFLSANEYPVLQFESAWALTNIISDGSTKQIDFIVVENNAISMFVSLLDSPNEDVREQAIWALGNISGHDYIHRDMVLKQNAIMPLIKIILSSPKISVVRNSIWTLSNFCRNKPPPSIDILRQALQVLALSVHHNDDEVKVDSLWALSYISDGNTENIQMVLESRVCDRLVELLSDTLVSVQTPALRTIGNLLTGDTYQSQIVLNNSLLLPTLLKLLNSPSKSIRKETTWTISNICAGTVSQIELVIQANLIPSIISLLSGDDKPTKKEAVWVFANIASGSQPDQINYIVKKGCVAPIFNLIFNSQDHSIITVGLEAIEKILQAGEIEKKTLGYNKYTKIIQNAYTFNMADKKKTNTEINALFSKINLNYFQNNNNFNVEQNFSNMKI